MASTKTYEQALRMASHGYPKGMQDSHAADCCHMMVDKIWRRYDWREAMASLPPFFLIPSQQDYGAPQSAVPSDFLGLRRAWMWNIGGERPTYYPILVRGRLDRTEVTGLPVESISYEANLKKFRIYPRASSGLDSSKWIIDGVYKTNPPQVAVSALGTDTLPWDDLYFDAVVRTLRWIIMGSDPQQEQVILGMISRMAGFAGLEEGPVPVHPAEALVDLGDYSF